MTYIFFRFEYLSDDEPKVPEISGLKGEAVQEEFHYICQGDPEPEVTMSTTAKSITTNPKPVTDPSTEESSSPTATVTATNAETVTSEPEPETSTLTTTTTPRPVIKGKYFIKTDNGKRLKIDPFFKEIFWSWAMRTPMLENQ